MRFAALLLAPLLCFAHESPEHRIEQLSFEMARNGKSAEALMERAIEYRALGELEAAAGDFEAVLSLVTNSIEALKGLSEIRSAQGRFRQALDTVNRAIAAGGDLYFTRAEIHAAAGNHQLALADCERAFAGRNGELEWYLTRAQIQTRLGRFEECIKGLKEGIEATGSAVLETELIDALIDAGKYREALRKIEPELAEARLRSAWLLRRARARIGVGKDARKDLTAALEELTARISPRNPDVTLVVERGMVLALLGQTDAARADLARVLHAGPTLVWRFEKLLDASGQKRQRAAAVQDADAR